MTVGQSNEHLRNYRNTDASLKKHGNYDPTRERLNFEITKGSVVSGVNKNLSIPQRITAILNARGIKDPNEGQENPTRRSLANIILGGSREQMHRLAFGEQTVDLTEGADNSHIARDAKIEEWAKDVYKFIAQKYGEDNIAAFIVHLDETNPHVHCSLLPINEKNKFSWNELFGGKQKDARQKYWNLHNELAKVNAKYGLERGEDIRHTGAKHRNTVQYQQSLRQESTQLENKVQSDRKEARKAGKKADRANTRLKGLTTMVNNLEKQKAQAEQEIAELRRQVKDNQQNNEDTLRLIKEKEHELRELEAKLNDKKEKLREANEQLQNQAFKLRELVNKQQEILPPVFERTKQEIDAVAWKETANMMIKTIEGIKEKMDKLSPHERSMLNEALDSPVGSDWVDSFLEAPNEIVELATSLALGYLDSATTVIHAQGGGSGPGTGWRKKDDEDDDAWRRRCFFGALRMMKPKQRRK